MNIGRCKNSQQNTSKWDPAVYKKDYAPWLTDIYPRHARLVQHTEINQTQHIYRINVGEHHVIVSINKKKYLKKIQHPSW